MIAFLNCTFLVLLPTTGNGVSALAFSTAALPIALHHRSPRSPYIHIRAFCADNFVMQLMQSLLLAFRVLVSGAFGWRFRLLAYVLVWGASVAARADTLLGTTSYTTSGNTTYSAPSGTNYIVVKVWGAGGGGQGGDGGFGNGGNGGFARASYLLPGGTIHVMVGAANSSGGGNASAVWVTGGFQVIGGGGGQGGAPGDSGPQPHQNGGDGGGGGGSSGPLNLSGGGGYAANGDSASGLGGAGGSGYYGGSGGSGSGDDGGDGGNGGSNYFDTSNGYITGSGAQNVSDSDKPSHAGEGAYDPEDDNPSDPRDGAVVIVAYHVNQPPVALFSPSPTSGRSPLSVSFNSGASYAPDGTITGYGWDFDNNGSTDSTAANPSHSYSNSGSSTVDFTAKLTVTDSNSATGNVTQTITVYPATSYTLSVLGGSVSGTSSPYYLPGSSVTLVANSPLSTQHFTGWTIVSGSGSFGTPAATTTTFSGTADSVVRANFGPTAPSSVASSTHTVANIILTWTASVDDIAVTGYDIYRTRSGLTNLIGSTSGSVVTFTDTHLTPSASYSYFVKARDGSGNVSDASSSLTVTADVPDSNSNGIPDNLDTLFGSSTLSADSSNSLKTHRPAP